MVGARDCFWTRSTIWEGTWVESLGVFHQLDETALLVQCTCFDHSHSRALRQSNPVTGTWAIYMGHGSGLSYSSEHAFEMFPKK